VGDLHAAAAEVGWGELPDLEEEPENQTEHREPGHDQLKEIELIRFSGHDFILAKSAPERPSEGRSDSVVAEDE